jgi:hypothetical protein
MKNRTYYIGIIVVFLLFLLVRVFAWINTDLLEDADSLLYLHDIDELLTFEFHRVVDFDPVSSIAYPILGAFFALPSGDAEAGARLASFAASIVMFFVLLFLGNYFGSREGILIGLLLVALNPLLISLSFAVLNEMVYIAIIYTALLFFVITINKFSM